MVKNCAVYHCKNTTYRNNPSEEKGEVTFHVFPKDPEQRERWISVLKNPIIAGKPWQPTLSSTVCSDHFVKDDYKETKLKKLLKVDAVPSLFMRPYFLANSDSISSNAFKTIASNLEPFDEEGACLIILSEDEQESDNSLNLFENDPQNPNCYMENLKPIANPQEVLQNPSKPELNCFKNGLNSYNVFEIDPNDPNLNLKQLRRAAPAKTNSLASTTFEQHPTNPHFYIENLRRETISRNPTKSSGNSTKKSCKTSWNPPSEEQTKCFHSYAIPQLTLKEENETLNQKLRNADAKITGYKKRCKVMEQSIRRKTRKIKKLEMELKIMKMKVQDEGVYKENDSSVESCLFDD